MWKKISTGRENLLKEGFLCYRGHLLPLTSAKSLLPLASDYSCCGVPAANRPAGLWWGWLAAATHHTTAPPAWAHHTTAAPATTTPHHPLSTKLPHCRMWWYSSRVSHSYTTTTSTILTSETNKTYHHQALNLISSTHRQGCPVRPTH